MIFFKDMSVATRIGRLYARLILEGYEVLPGSNDNDHWLLVCPNDDRKKIKHSTFYKLYLDLCSMGLNVTPRYEPDQTLRGFDARVV
jgi:hypothetical protein